MIYEILTIDPLTGCKKPMPSLPSKEGVMENVRGKSKPSKVKRGRHGEQPDFCGVLSSCYMLICKVDARVSCPLDI
jgi:hypothetical protein